MSRWIDADAFKTWIDEYVSVFKKSDKVEIKGYISHQPTIEIIRCRECKYWRAYETWSECVLWAGDSYETAKTKADDFCSYGEVSEILTSSEKPNNCEHITEDGVTCAKYPACDDCLDNPLNKVKGSERLVKGSERSSE